MRLLFTSGTARGGTNFRTLILNGHPAIAMSLDPLIPLFRCYRDGLLESAGKGDLLARAPSGALDDYYFDDAKLAAMKTVQEADPDIAFNPANWEKLKAAISARMQLASVNLVPHLEKLRGASFREVFQSSMELAASVKSGSLVWAGYNDNWAMEFFRPIARLLPEAKFMLHLRDPRAVVGSSEFAEPDPRKRPTIVSFARHLRKYLAFSQALPPDPLMQGRLLVTTYEPFLRDLARETRRMTDFLGVDYRDEMIDVSRFRKANGAQWGSDWPIYQASGDSWRREMPREMVELVEFVCGPEMALRGYAPEVYDEAKGLSADTFLYAARNARECLGWRTDFPEVEKTLGCEFYRRRLLAAGGEFPAQEVERCFLFRAVYDRLREQRGERVH